MSKISNVTNMLHLCGTSSWNKAKHLLVAMMMSFEFYIGRILYLEDKKIDDIPSTNGISYIIYNDHWQNNKAAFTNLQQ